MAGPHLVWRDEIEVRPNRPQHVVNAEFETSEFDESESESLSVVSSSLRPHVLYSPWNSPGQSTGVGSPSLLQGISGDWTQVSHIAAGFFTSLATREPKNTGVGSLSFLQQIFRTHKSNLGPLLCRWILYQLSYQGSPSELDICHQTVGRLWRFVRWRITGCPILCFRKKLYDWRLGVHVLRRSTNYC